MTKITMSEAKKMCRGGEFYMMHIEWFTPDTGYSHLHGVDLRQENPDCSNVIVKGVGHWREHDSVVALVLDTDFQKEVKEKWEDLKEIEKLMEQTSD